MKKLFNKLTGDDDLFYIMILAVLCFISLC